MARRRSLKGRTEVKQSRSRGGHKPQRVRCPRRSARAKLSILPERRVRLVGSRKGRKLKYVKKGGMDDRGKAANEWVEQLELGDVYKVKQRTTSNIHAGTLLCVREVNKNNVKFDFINEKGHIGTTIVDFPTEGYTCPNLIYPLIMHEGGESNVEKDHYKSNLCKGQTFNYSPGTKYKVNADVCPDGITYMGIHTFPIDTVGTMVERSGHKFLRYPNPQGDAYHDMYFNLTFSTPFLSLLFVPAADSPEVAAAAAADDASSANSPSGHRGTDIDSWLAEFSLPDQHTVKIREKLGEFVQDMNDFKELDNEDVQQLVIFVQQLEGLSDAKKKNLAIAIKGLVEHPAM